MTHEQADEIILLLRATVGALGAIGDAIRAHNAAKKPQPKPTPSRRRRPDPPLPSELTKPPEKPEGGQKP